MEQLLEIADVGLCAVIDEHLVQVEMYATRNIIVLQDGIAQEFIALLRTIAVEGRCIGHLRHSLLHCRYHSRAKRLCHIADAQGNDISLGMHHLEGIHLLRNVGKQIVILQI